MSRRISFYTVNRRTFVSDPANCAWKMFSYSERKWQDVSPLFLSPPAITASLSNAPPRWSRRLTPSAMCKQSGTEAPRTNFPFSAVMGVKKKKQTKKNLFWFSPSMLIFRSTNLLQIYIYSHKKPTEKQKSNCQFSVSKAGPFNTTETKGHVDLMQERQLAFTKPLQLPLQQQSRSGSLCHFTCYLHFAIYKNVHNNFKAVIKCSRTNRY